MAASYHRSWWVWRFAIKDDGVGFATESYATLALYTTLASLSGALWRIRRAKCAIVGVLSSKLAGAVFRLA
jgi:hypothetical protein